MLFSSEIKRPSPLYSYLWYHDQTINRKESFNFPRSRDLLDNALRVALPGPMFGSSYKLIDPDATWLGLQNNGTSRPTWPIARLGKLGGPSVYQGSPQNSF